MRMYLRTLCFDSRTVAHPLDARWLWDFLFGRMYLKMAEVKKMDIVKEKILTEGVALSETALKVDNFLNNQVDPQLMHEIGQVFQSRIEGRGITNVRILESS